MSVAAVRFEGDVEVPWTARTWTGFRRWCFSSDFPDRGRIDFIRGRIEVDLSPERALSHGLPKVELIRALATYVRESNLGHIFADRMRVSSQSAKLSAEPDLVFVTHRSLKSGRVKFAKPSRTTPIDYLELQGGPDLVVEILSPSSDRKDTAELPAAYFAAGVREYWLLNAMQCPVRLKLFRRGKSQFVQTRVDQQGFQMSRVLQKRIQFVCELDADGFPRYELVLR